MVESWEYNGRLQTILAKATKGTAALLELAFTYGGSSNNGNVQTQSIIHRHAAGGSAFSATQSYSYDPLNRLGGVNEGTDKLTQTFAYDRWGNRALTAGWYPKPVAAALTAYDTARNQWPAGGFDARGNQTAVMSWTHQYDAENRLVQSNHTQGDEVKFEYDGNGRRVRKIGALGSVRFVYDAMGQLVAEYGGVASPAPLTFLSGDHLGTTRLVTDATGAVLKRYDYAPFGEEIPKGQMGRPTGEFPVGDYPSTVALADGLAPKFTGKERDAETGLDYFGARYMSAAQGRFTSPDVPLLDQQPGDPQSWNLYSYVRSNPLIFTDPTGNDCVYVNSGGNGIDSINSQNTSKDCGKTGGYWVDGTVTNARFAHGSLILTGTTNGENRTSASYGLGADPGLMALQQIPQLAEPGVRLAAVGTAALVGGAFAGVAYGGWAGGTALNTLAIPVATLAPLVSNPTLQAIVNKLFQASDKLPGGTAGAVRYERLTGDLMSPSGHSGKAQEVIVAVWNLMKSGKLTLNDQIVGRQIIQELSDALKTQPRK